MENPVQHRYIVQTEEGPPHGDLYELEQTTYFHVVDTATGEIILTLRGEMYASLSREDAQWDDYSYSGVRDAAIAEDGHTLSVSYFDGTEEQISLPESPRDT